MQEMFDFNLVDKLSEFALDENLELSAAAKLLRLTWIPPPSELKRKRESSLANVSSEVKRNIICGGGIYMIFDR